jgi:hypothetical protein
VNLVKWIKSTSPCPDRGQFPQLDDSGPRRSAYKRGHVNQSSVPTDRNPKPEGPIPLGAAAAGCTNAILVIALLPIRRCRLWFTCYCRSYGMNPFRCIPELLLEIYKQSIYTSRHPLDLASRGPMFFIYLIIKTSSSFFNY